MMIFNLESMGHFRIRYTMLLSLLGISNIGLFQRGDRPGLGQRNKVFTTCKAVTLRGGQQIIAVFFTQRF